MENILFVLLLTWTVVVFGEVKLTSRYKRDASDIGNRQISKVATGCESLDHCMNRLRNILMSPSLDLTRTSCLPVVEELVCMHDIIDTSPICIDLYYYKDVNYKLDMISIQLRLFCGKYGELSPCTQTEQCINKINFPQQASLLAEPQYWCAYVQTVLKCTYKYKDTCNHTGQDFSTIQLTLDHLCPQAIDVSDVTYTGSSSTNIYISKIHLLVILLVIRWR